MIDRRFIYQIAVRETLLAILSRKGQVGRRAAHDARAGFSGPIFPGVSSPHLPGAARVFSSLHTADEHTLVCIEMLDKIIDATEPPFVKYKQILQNVAKPHILYLAMLLQRHGQIGE